MSDEPEADIQEQLEAFQDEVHDAIREIAAKHFRGWFLRAHVLSIGLYAPDEEDERIDVFAPEGQSLFTTTGLLSQAHYMRLQ